MSSVDKKLEGIKERLRIYPPYSNRQYIRPLSFAEYPDTFLLEKSLREDNRRVRKVVLNSSHPIFQRKIVKIRKSL